MTSHPSPIPVRSIDDSSRSRWFVPQPVGFMASVGMTALLLGISLPAGATGFLDGDLSSWSGASICSAPPSSCVEGLGSNKYDVFGSSSYVSSYVITSQAASVAQAISFKYSFDGLGGGWPLSNTVLIVETRIKTWHLRVKVNLPVSIMCP